MRRRLLTDPLPRTTQSLLQCTRGLVIPQGGNRQKPSIGKWLAADCGIIIFGEPTAGADAGSKAFIHDPIFELARDKGKSIILISSNPPETAKIARRVLVFRKGRIMGEAAGINEDGATTEPVSKRIGDILIWSAEMKLCEGKRSGYKKRIFHKTGAAR